MSLITLILNSHMPTAVAEIEPLIRLTMSDCTKHTKSILSVELQSVFSPLVAELEESLKAATSKEIVRDVLKDALVTVERTERTVSELVDSLDGLNVKVNDLVSRLETQYNRFIISSLSLLEQ